MFTLDDFLPDTPATDASGALGGGGTDAFGDDTAQPSGDPCQSYDPFDVVKCAGNAIGSAVTSIFGSVLDPVTNEVNYLVVLLIAAIVVIIALIAFNAKDLSKIFDIKVIA